MSGEFHDESLLTPDDMSTIANAAVECALYENDCRLLILNGLPRSITSRLRAAATLYDQIMWDLMTLSKPYLQAVDGRDGAYLPLELWLRNAATRARVCHHVPAASIFDSFRAQITEAHREGFGPTLEMKTGGITSLKPEPVEPEPEPDIDMQTTPGGSTLMFDASSPWLSGAPPPVVPESADWGSVTNPFFPPRPALRVPDPEPDPEPAVDPWDVALIGACLLMVIIALAVVLGT